MNKTLALEIKHAYMYTIEVDSMANLREQNLVVIVAVFLFSVNFAQSGETSNWVQRLEELLEQREPQDSDLPPEAPKVDVPPEPQDLDLPKEAPEVDVLPSVDNSEPHIAEEDILPPGPNMCHGLQGVIRRLEELADHFEFLTNVLEESDQDSYDVDGLFLERKPSINSIAPNGRAARRTLFRRLQNGKLRIRR